MCIGQLSYEMSPKTRKEKREKFEAYISGGKVEPTSPPLPKPT